MKKQLVFVMAMMLSACLYGMEGKKKSLPEKLSSKREYSKEEDKEKKKIANKQEKKAKIPFSRETKELFVNCFERQDRVTDQLSYLIFLVDDLKHISIFELSDKIAAIKKGILNAQKLNRDSSHLLVVFRSFFEQHDSSSSSKKEKKCSTSDSSST